VPVVNIKGVAAGALTLDGATLAAIYLGDIKKWNDERVQKLNPKLALPDSAIAPVYRSDGSGRISCSPMICRKKAPSSRRRSVLSPRCSALWNQRQGQ